MIRKINNFDPDRIEPAKDYLRPNDPRHKTPLYIAELDEDSLVSVTRSSLRQKRKVLTIALTAFTVGALLIVFNSPFRNTIIAPGPLCSSHAQILSEQGENRCSACHASAKESFTGWVAATLSGGQSVGPTQSTLCMECHEKSLVPAMAVKPHNVDPVKLSQTTSEFVGTTGSSASLNLFAGNHHEIACSACHREHHGTASLTKLTDAQCQTCHTQVFHSFELDHPEFSNWPQQQRSGIAFDHASHAAKHFPGKETDFDCASCHVDDSFQIVKRMRPFAESCAVCHDQQILESGQSGITLVSLPILDLDVIRENKIDIGSWPDSATGDFDGPLPPFMRLLLSADPNVSVMLEELGHDFHFGDVDPDDPRQVQLACGVVWGIKNLLNDLALNGSEGLKVRLEAILDRPLNEGQLTGLMAGIRTEDIARAVGQWLPELGAELASRQPDELFQRFQYGRETILANVRPASPQDDDVLIVNPLKGLLRGVEQPAGKPDAPGLTSDATNRSPTAGSQQPSSTSRQPGIPSAASGAGEQLVANPLSNRIEAMDGNGLPIRQPNSLEGTAIEINNTGSTIGRPEESAATPPSTSSPKRLRALPPETQIPVGRSGGWYRDDALLQIKYQPSGHADAFVKSWTDLIVSTPASTSHSSTASLFESLTSPTGVGQCRSCHTLDQVGDSEFRVNWGPKYRDPSIRSFTKFSHGPHLLQPQLRDCTACHQLDVARTNADTFVSVDWAAAVSNFEPIKKANCANCHRENQTSNRCTQCHNYHIGSKVTQ